MPDEGALSRGTADVIEKEVRMEEEKWQKGREGQLLEVADEDTQIYACIRRKWVEPIMG